MQKLQESVFSIVKTTSLSPAVFSFLQPTEDFSDKTLPLGGILRDTKYGWLSLGPKFCVVDLRSGLKVAARTFGNGGSNNINVTSVVELPTPLTENSQQLIISLEVDGTEGLICVFHVNGSQLLCCIKTDVVVIELAVCDDVPSGPLICFDGVVMAGTCQGEIIVFDLNRSSLVQALKDISQGLEHLVRNEENPASLVYLPLKAMHMIEAQRVQTIENDDHLGVLLNEDSFIEGQYIFRNPDGTVRMKAKQNHIRVTVLQYIPQLGSLAVGFNFGAFQIWNMMNLELEFTSQVNVECLPVTHFGFQEPCDDPRAFCYLWVVFSVIDRFEEEEFPLAVMYSLTYQGKRMLTDTKSLYQEFSTATIRFQVELCAIEDVSQFIGGRCISCHCYSISSTLGEEGEDSMLNLCQLVWECWGETPAVVQYGMLLFDLDQWYKDQMPATYPLESNAFMSTARCPEISRGTCLTLDLRLDPATVAPYSHATRLEEHFYPNSLQYNCICLNTSEASTIHTVGVQRQILRAMCAAGPGCLLSPARLHAACRAAGLAPLYCDVHAAYAPTPEEQRHFLLSVALEARLSRFLKRCAHDWATGTHSGVGCTLTFLVDWCWKRALELKENAKELTAPLFTSSTLPDRNVLRCLEHCVQQLTSLTGLLDAVLTKCCNLVVPDALSEMEEKYKAIGTVSLYFQVVQWFVRVGLLPERLHSYDALPYPAPQLYATYNKRRAKLHRLLDNSDEDCANKPCPLLYIDQLIENEFGGERIHQMWIKGGSECGGLYPPPSLYALLRLYLLPEIALEHKHSLVLYLLLDYSMLYDEMRSEAVIRRLMQFPTMVGLSNTAIKATQAFWHLDHRDFDFALDQLQCLTGNTLSGWQHHVVLSSLLAQKKTQAALQYLHVKKPAPIQNMKDGEDNVNEHYKLEDWQSCCNLYLARGLVFEALDVIRMCVRNADSVEDKAFLLNFFYKGCRNTGQLSKILQATLSPFEEEVFIKYLQGCNESHTSELLVMYYLQQARYLEAEQYNAKIKSRGRPKDMATSTESILDVLDREGARDTLVEYVCSALPTIATSVARVALTDFEPHILQPKPMSVYVQASSPKNTFTYKSSFIQDTIENASETWVNRPKLRKGIKRALSIQDTPFICTPKAYKWRSILTSEQRGSEATPAKRAKLDLTGTPRTPKMPCSLKVSDALSQEMASLLDMPEVQTPPTKYYDRSGADTPQSILKNRGRLDDRDREAPSPADSRYLCDTDEEELETASNHTHYSDSTNKHLRFTIPTASEDGSTPSPVAVPVQREPKETEDESERGGHSDSYKTTMITDGGILCDACFTLIPRTTSEDQTTPIPDFGHHKFALVDYSEAHPMESPPKKFAAEGIKSKKIYKDSVRARLSLSVSMNSSLSEDQNDSIESIADIPVTLFNPRYSGGKRNSPSHFERETESESRQERNEKNIKYERQYRSETKQEGHIESEIEMKQETQEMEVEEENTIRNTLMSRTPRARRGIRSGAAESTPRSNRNYSATPERVDSPVVTPLRPIRATRTKSRSRTPELSPRSSPLAPIIEQPKQEVESEPHPKATTLSIPRQLRSRSRTPERQDKLHKESPRLEAIKESPTKPTDSPPASPSRRNLRSRSRTPEVTVLPEQVAASPRSLRSRSRTPEVTVLSEQVAASPRSLRSRSRTPEVTVLPEQVAASPRSLRSRSRTPEVTVLPEQVAASPRSLRSRSRTPDVEIIAEQNALDSPRRLRSRSRTPDVEIITPESAAAPSPRSIRSCRAKTPEKIMSPKTETITRSKKSLTRIVLENNAFAKTKQIEIMETEIVEERSESVIECTPKKSFKEIPSLMDMNFSPITNKSVLQSSESFLSESNEKDRIEESDNSALTKPLPSFTINETYGKSVLVSYESSVGDNSDTHEEKADAKVIQSDVKLSAFTTIHEDNGKSVLQSAESSIAESNNQGTNITKTKEDEMPRISFKLNETEEEKSVLKSCDSSMAETENSVSKVNRHEVELKESSPMTCETELQIKHTWKTKMETQDRVIQKEKESIVEIEREINEIEGEMSDDCRETDSENEVEELDEEEGDESEENGDEIEEEEEEDDSSDGVEDESGEEEESEEENDDNRPISQKEKEEAEVIFINDSDSSSDYDKLEIDEVEKSPSFEAPLEDIEVVEYELFEELPAQQMEQPSEPSEVSKFEAVEQIENVPTEPETIKEIILGSEEIIETATKFELNKEVTAETEAINKTPQEYEKVDEANIKLNTADETPMEYESLLENTVNPLDQAQMISILTDDNSVIESDRSHNLNYSQSHTVEQADGDMKSSSDIAMDVVQEVVAMEYDSTAEDTVNQLDQAQMLSMLTDDNSAIESDRSLNLNYSEGQTVEQTDMQAKSVEHAVEQGNMKASGNEHSVKQDDMKNDHPKKSPEAVVTRLDYSQTTKAKMVSDVVDAIDENKDIDMTEINDNENDKTEKPKSTRKRTKSTTSNKSSDGEQKVAPKTPTRKRSQSTSTKSEDNKPSEGDKEVSTPSRKRTISTPSDGDKTSETKNEVSTPRRRAKTPTSAETRQILTRRASKELNVDTSVTEEEVLTPRRRSARSRSINDDNASVVSDKSVKSTGSRASEDGGDVKGVRKRRQSLKPELTVIPEVSSEDTKSETLEDIVAETRRLTRNQKIMLDSLLEEKGNASASPARTPRTPRRRGSATSRAEVDDDASSTHSGADEGSIATDESRASPDSTTTVRPRGRLTRAASETKASPKPVRATRRMSVDVAVAAESASPASATRGRRASFTRACEALHAPRGRRLSTELRSQQGSPASEADAPATPASPARRARRARQGSTASEADAATPATPGRRGLRAKQGSPGSEAEAPPTPATPARRGRRASQK